MDLPARSPTHVIHQLRTSLHAASLKCEPNHTNLPRLYPHTRVTGYEPSRSYHHVLPPSMNLPVHGTSSPDPSSPQLHPNNTHCNIPKEYYSFLINKTRNKINTSFNIIPFPKNTGNLKLQYTYNKNRSP